MYDVLIGFYHMFDFFGDGTKWYHNFFSVVFVCSICPLMFPVCLYLTRNSSANS